MYVIYASELGNSESNYFFRAYLNPTIRKEMDPRRWWKSAGTSGIIQAFIDFVDTLFTYPASTASIERAFSTLGGVMTKQRNRLSLEKAAKLCSIINHYKIKMKIV